MTLILSGTDGVSDIDGTAGTPAIRGSDTNTGIFFGADIIGFSEGGTECARFNADAQFVAAAGTALLPVITTTGDVNTGIFFPAADTIAFAEGGAEAMRIDSSGNLLVGKTTVAAFTTQGVEITPSTTGANLAVTSTSASNYDMVRLTRTGTTGIMIGFFNGTSRVGDVSIGASSTAYNTSSDYRLKEAITPMQGALARVAALKPVTYKWKVDGSDGEGFIAHEVQEVAPYAVSGEKDGEQMQGVDYGKLTPILTAALQEAIAKIETLEARIAVLEAK